jgi:excisionase family DNA binding protein
MARALPFTPATVTLDQLVANPELATELTPVIRSQLLTRCAAVLAALAGAIAAPSDQPPTESAVSTQPEWLTVPEAASIMRFKPSYVYEMARRGDLPSVRKPGKKYVRIRRSAIEQWIAENEHRGLDRGISRVLSSPCDRQRDQTRPQGSGCEPNRTRRKTRRASDDGQPLGA